jgi:hypothetical protein
MSERRGKRQEMRRAGCGIFRLAGAAELQLRRARAGSTSGIGLGIAQALVRSGHNVVVNGFGSAEEIKNIVAQLRSEYVRNS